MGLNLKASTAAQDTCEDTQSYRTAITGMTVPDVPVHDSGPSLLCDTSSSNPRPKPTSRGYSYLLTILDRTTRWPETVIPLQDIIAASCAGVFMTGWVTRFAVLLEMTSDRGRQFISSLWSEMARSLVTQLHRTTSYHPQPNGMVERFHRSLKARYEPYEPAYTMATRSMNMGHRSCYM